MKKVIGQVKRVYLPDEKINGEPVLDLYKTNIGFEIEIKGKTFNYIEKQNKENVKIHRLDKVYVFFDLEKSKLPIAIKVVE